MATVLALLAALVSPESDWARELMRFPPESQKGLRAAREYRRYAEALATANADVPEFGWDVVRRQGLYVESCWDDLNDARRFAGYSCGAHWAKVSLSQLRRRIGEENYRDGLMPLIPPVPGAKNGQ